MCACHPSLSKASTLAADVTAAAAEAAERFPDAPRFAELLAAYYSAKVDYIGQKPRFYRPRSQRNFFAYLEDIVTNAEDWARFHGWKPRNKTATPPQPAPAPASDLSDEERTALLQEISNLKSNHTQQP